MAAECLSMATDIRLSSSSAAKALTSGFGLYGIIRGSKPRFSGVGIFGC